MNEQRYSLSKLIQSLIGILLGGLLIPPLISLAVDWWAKVIKELLG